MWLHLFSLLSWSIPYSRRCLFPQMLKGIWVFTLAPPRAWPFPSVDNILSNLAAYSNVSNRVEANISIIWGVTQEKTPPVRESGTAYHNEIWIQYGLKRKSKTTVGHWEELKGGAIEVKVVCFCNAEKSEACSLPQEEPRGRQDWKRDRMGADVICLWEGPGIYLRAQPSTVSFQCTEVPGCVLLWLHKRLVEADLSAVGEGNRNWALNPVCGPLLPFAADSSQWSKTWYRKPAGRIRETQTRGLPSLSQ